MLNVHLLVSQNKITDYKGIEIEKKSKHGFETIFAVLSYNW